MSAGSTFKSLSDNEDTLSGIELESFRFHDCFTFTQAF